MSNINWPAFWRGFVNGLGFFGLGRWIARRISRGSDRQEGNQT